MVKSGRIFRNWLILAALLLSPWSGAPALAHYQVVWPQFEGCYAKPGEAVKWQYFWGHPYDMLIDDAETPKVFIFTPEEKKENLEPQENTLKDPVSGRDRKAFTVEYKPPPAWGTTTCAWRARRILFPVKKFFGRTTSRSRCMS